MSLNTIQRNFYQQQGYLLLENIIFDSRILPGTPTRTGRMKNLPFRIAQPRAPDADSIYDDQNIMNR